MAATNTLAYYIMATITTLKDCWHREKKKFYWMFPNCRKCSKSFFKLWEI